MSQEPVGFPVLPYIHRVMDHIGRLLNRRGARTIYKLTKELQQFLRPVKDAKEAEGLYSVACSCGDGVYRHNKAQRPHPRR